MQKLLSLLAAFAIGGAAGYFLSNLNTDSRETGFPEPAKPAATQSSTKEVEAVAQSPDTNSLNAPESILSTFSQRVEAAMADDSYRKRQYELERIFENLTAEEAPAVLGEIMDISDPRKRGSLLRPFFVKWGELGGEAAFEAANAIHGRSRSDAMSAVLAGWAHTDVHASWEAAKGMLSEASYSSIHLTRGAVAELAKQDPEALLTFLAEDTSGQMFNYLSNSLVTMTIDEGSPELLLSKLHLLENGDTQNKLLGSLFHRWGGMETDAPLQALGSIEDPEAAKSALGGFLQGWVESDVEGALNYAFDNRDDAAVKGAFPQMLREALQFGSREQNIALVDRLESQGMAQDVALDVARSISFMQPEIAMRLADSIEDVGERQNVQAQTVSVMARNNVEQAVQYFENAESNELKSRYLSSMSWALSTRSDGGDHLISMLKQLPEGPERSRVVDNLVQSAVSRGQRQTSQNFKEAIVLLAESESQVSPELKAKAANLVSPDS